MHDPLYCSEAAFLNFHSQKKHRKFCLAQTFSKNLSFGLVLKVLTSSVQLCNHLLSKVIVALEKPLSVAFDLAIVADHKIAGIISFIFGKLQRYQFLL